MNHFLIAFSSRELKVDTSLCFIIKSYQDLSDFNKMFEGDSIAQTTCATDSNGAKSYL